MIDMVMGSIKGGMRGNGGISADLWKMPPANLRVIDGFNPRIKTDAYAARVRWLADSIKENGYMLDKPLTGYVAKEDGKDVAYVTGGHRRHEAVLLAISEGFAVEFVPVIVPSGQSMADLEVATVVGNGDEPLTTYEIATVCKRLVGRGLDSKQIAKRLGYSSAQYVDNLLMLAAAPLAIHGMVISEAIKATTAIDALREHGDKAVAVLTKALAKAGAGARVTGSNVTPEKAFTKVLRKQAQPLYNALATVTGDPGYSKLAPETLAAIAAVMEKVEPANQRAYFRCP